jgi:CheY-like chemotaxis protein
LLEAQKMEAIGRLAGGVAHDFNNLLTAIGGYAGLILDELAPEHPLRSDVQQIVSASDRAAGLTRQLLAFGRRQVIQPRPLRLDGVVLDMDKLLRRIIGEDIDLVTLVQPGVGEAMADPSQFEQVVLNLAINARDAMPEGGKLTLEVGSAVVGRESPQLAPGAYVVLSVSDTGCGMDADTRARVFEPFFTTKEVGQGTGLGLATVYGVVKQHGGHVTCYSEVGHGSVFRVYLPRTDRDTPVSDTPPQHAPAAVGCETVLLVEDEAAVRLLTQRVLTQQGYQVLVASDPLAALSLAETEGHRLDLLLTDVVMPHLSGRELAERLRASRPELRVLFMSGYTDDAVFRHGELGPGSAFIHKPFTPTALGHKLREVLDGRP